MRILTLIPVSALIAGCAASMQLEDSARARIRSISISEKVIVPEKPAYIGSGSAFGALGALVESASDQPQAIKDFLAKNNVDVGQIVREQFTQEARQHAFLGSRLQPDGEARIEIGVRIYGLSLKRGFSNDYVPMLGYEVKLFDAANALVWQKYDYVTAFTDGIPVYEFEEYFKSGAAFRAAYAQSARIIARNMLREIQ